MIGVVVGLAACGSAVTTPAPVVTRVPSASPPPPPHVAPRVDIPIGAGAGAGRVPLPSAGQAAASEPTSTDSAQAPASPASATPVAGAGSPGSVPSDGVESAPVRSGRIEARPLGGGTIALPSQAPAVPADGTVRTTPDGLKKPYSEAALAAMRAQGGGAQGGSPGASATPGPASAGTAGIAGAAATRTPLPTANRPFAWPAGGRIIRRFSDAKSMGIAIEGSPGDPIVAAADGKVIFSGLGPKGYGQLLIVKHDDDLLSVYAHNRSLLVKEGQSVRRGQRIAELGATGASSPQLHFEIRRQGKPIDPLTMLPER